MANFRPRAHTDTEIELEILKWASVLGPVAFLVMFEYFKQIIFAPEMPPAVSLAVTIPTVFLPAILFSSYVFSRFRRLERKITAQRDGAEALLRVAQVLNASLELDAVLQTVVDEAREHLRADYGELHFLKGQSALHGVRFSGIVQTDCQVRERPDLSGLNGEVLRTGQAMRFENRRQHPASLPLPKGHVDVGPLLGVPIFVRGQPVADILLVRRSGGTPFEAEDEEFLTGIANQAGAAIENARLAEREQEVAVLTERDRIAQEMHDGLAQMLGLIHLKAKTAENWLLEDRVGLASSELAQISKSAQQAYAQVRRTIFDLRTTLSPDLGLERALAIHVRQFSETTGVRVKMQLASSQPESGDNGS